MKWLIPCFFALAVVPSSMQCKEKKSIKQIDISEYEKNKEKIKEKWSNFKKNLKERLKFFSSQELPASEKEELLGDLLHLIAQVENGSLEAINVACEILDVDSTSYLYEALQDLCTAIVPYEESQTYQFQFCRKFIGDDGCEYDDGVAEEEIAQRPFHSIPLHLWEKKIVEKIVTNLAEKSLAQLLLERKEMEKRGDQIRHLHPLRFLGVVFTDSYLTACLNQFRGAAFKWSNFLDGCIDRMKEEMAKGNLEPHLEAFCEYVDKDYKIVSNYISKGDYEGFIYYLMSN